MSNETIDVTIHPDDIGAVIDSPEFVWAKHIPGQLGANVLGAMNRIRYRVFAESMQDPTLLAKQKEIASLVRDPSTQGDVRESLQAECAIMGHNFYSPTLRDSSHRLVFLPSECKYCRRSEKQ